jgi:hypothetical protein
MKELVQLLKTATRVGGPLRIGTTQYSLGPPFMAGPRAFYWLARDIVKSCVLETGASPAKLTG